MSVDRRWLNNLDQALSTMRFDLERIEMLQDDLDLKGIGRTGLNITASCHVNGVKHESHLVGIEVDKHPALFSELAASLARDLINTVAGNHLAARVLG